MKNVIITLILFCSLITCKGFGQAIFGPDTANYKVYVQKYGSNNPVSHVAYSNNIVPIGNNGSYKSRVFYQWNIPDNLIPDNSQIDTVEVTFKYVPVVSNYYISVYYSNVGVDLQSSSASTLWDITSNSSYTIGTGYGNKYGTTGSQQDTVTSVFLLGSDFNNAIQDSLVNDRFTLGISALTESYQYLWNITNSSVIIRIAYTPPQKTVTIDQKLSSGSRTGKIKIWGGTSFGSELNPPQNISFPISSNQVIKGDQAIYSNQKYNNWTRNTVTESDVLNHHSFLIRSNDNNFTSNFAPTYSGISIKNSLEEGLSNGGTVQFKDPWFIDYADPNYGNNKRNRGTSAPFVSRTSPFNPDYTTNYSGDTYEGIFLNQTVNSGNYYSVQTPETQTINSVTSYFQNWSATGATLSQVGSNPAGYDQKAVVFTSSSAVVTANYKGHLYTNSSIGTTTNSQRKIVQSSTGDWAMVYTSLNEVWLSRSTDGTNWEKDIKISDDGNVDGYPSIAISGSLAYIVWQGIDWAGGTGFDYGGIFMRSYNLSNNTLGSTATIETFTPNIEAFQANPVIDGAWGTSYDVKMIAWREPNGIKVKKYDDNDAWSSIGSVSGTNGYSYNPSISYYSSHPFLLCWEDRQNASNDNIKYIEASYSGSWSFTSSYTVSPSNWESNSNPQITLVGGNKPTVVWTSRNNVAEGIPSVHVRQKISGTWQSTITSFTYSSNTSATPAPVIGDYSGNNKMDVLWNIGNTVFKGSYNGSSWTGPTTVTTSGGTGVSINKSTSYQTKALWKKSDNTIAFYDVGGTAPPKIAASKINKEVPLPYRLNRHAIIELAKGIDSTAKGSVCFEIAGMNTSFNNNETKINYSENDNSMSSEPFKVAVPGMELNFRGAIYGKGLEFSNKLVSSISEPLAKVVLKDSKSGAVLKDVWTNNPSMLNLVSNKTFGEFRESKVNLNNFLGKTVYVEVELLGKAENVKPIIDNDYLILSDSASSENNLGKTAVVYDLPSDYKLMQNYPNPFNPSTTISFYLPESRHVTVKIYNTLGKEIMTAANGNMEQGYHAVNLDMSNESSGIYFYTLSAGNFRDTKKLLLLK